MAKTTIKQKEIDAFNNLAATWWDADGPMAPLHAMNPARMEFITAQIRGHFKRLPEARLDNLKIVDIGCGGGITAEPLARLGADVTGIDAATKNIEIAKQHADEGGLAIAYHAMTAEDFIKTSPKQKFDVVMGLEIIEHVDAPEIFIQSCAMLLKPGGILILSTLNRTVKSYALGIIAAEYIMGWLPKGTHDWRMFKKPSELAALCAGHGLGIKSITGINYNILNNSFKTNPEGLDVNYIMSFSDR